MAGDPLEMLMGGDSGGPDKPAAAPEDDAAKDILAAIKANDAKALSLALTRHYEACDSDEVEPDEDDSDEEA